MVGRTAAQRRKSRVELWRNLPNINVAQAHPEVRNSVGTFVFTSQEARAHYLGDPHLENIMAKLKANARFNASALDDYFSQTPATRASVVGLT